MGIAFVLLIWGILGLFLACMGLCALAWATAFLTRGVPEGRRRAIIASGLFPFGCLAWAVVVFFFQAYVNLRYFDRDPGMGDTWECPVPNGYSIVMIDVTDQGTIFNPKTQRSRDGVSSQDDTVFGVRTLQVSGPYLLGGVDGKYFDHLANGKAQVDSYFVLDSRTGKRRDFPSAALLGESARQLGIPLKLEPIEQVYDEFRPTWFDRLALVILLAPPLICFALLVRWVVRLRRTRPAGPLPA
jgi:hypothetical protein